MSNRINVFSELLSFRVGGERDEGQKKSEIPPRFLLLTFRGKSVFQTRQINYSNTGYIENE